MTILCRSWNWHVINWLVCLWYSWLLISQSLYFFHWYSFVWSWVIIKRGSLLYLFYFLYFPYPWGYLLLAFHFFGTILRASFFCRFNGVRIHLHNILFIYLYRLGIFHLSFTLSSMVNMTLLIVIVYSWSTFFDFG